MILREIAKLMDIGCKAIGKEYTDIRICELGDQRMKWHPAKTGKQYLTEKGIVEHISIDWNGKNGALKRDLSKPLNEWDKYFDMVTNYGTTEHVNNGQYEAFQNIHNITKQGGVMVHAIPLVEYWAGHCDYHYTDDFSKVIAKANGYECILSESIMVSGRRGKQQLLSCGVLVKTIDSDFMSKEDFIKMGTITGL